MLTAGPGMMGPGYAPQGVYNAAQGVYAPSAAAQAAAATATGYQGYGMWGPNARQHLLFL